MFTNIGKKIKTLAAVCFYIAAVLFALAGILIIVILHTAIGLAVIVGGILFCWIMSFYVYGFGELIESSSRARDNTKKLSTLLHPIMQSKNSATSQGTKAASAPYLTDVSSNAQKSAETTASAAPVRQRVVVGDGGNADSLLRRAFLFLEDGDWDSATECCEAVLDFDPESGRAYLGKLMAEQHVRHEEDLADCPQPFDSSNAYQKAVRFGDSSLSAKLKEYNAGINLRNESERLTGLYQKASALMSAATTDTSFRAAAEIFQSIGGYRDAEALAKECVEKAENCRKDGIYRWAKTKMAQENLADYTEALSLLQSIPGWKDADEQASACQDRIVEISAERMANEQIEREKRENYQKAIKKKRAGILIAAAAILICFALVIVYFTAIQPRIKRHKAAEMLENGDYDSAYALLEEINDQDTIISSKYNRACAYLEAEDYESAYALLSEIGRYDIIAESQEERKEKEKESAEQAVDTAVPAPTEGPKPTDGPAPTRDPMPTQAPLDSAEPIGAITILVNALRVRSSPSISVEELSKTAKGDVYRVYEIISADGYTWYRIGKDAWVADKGGAYVSFTTQTDQRRDEPIGILVIQVNALRIRQTPGTSGEEIGQTEKGNVYAVYDISQADGYTWYRIGQNAWVADKNGEYGIYAEGCRQVVFAKAFEYNGSYYAAISVSDWTGDKWEKRLSGITAAIGANGITTDKHEGDHCTPSGTFHILFCFSDRTLETGLRQKTLCDGDVWVTDQNSRYYNTIQSDSARYKDWTKSENIYRQLTSGRSVAGIFFDYNGDGETAGSATPGAGAALFLDGVGSNGSLDTGYGDVKLRGEDMLRLLKVLNSSLNPVIIIVPEK